MLNFKQGENSHGARKIIISTVIILVAILLIALIFDWGRREAKAPELNSDASTTQSYPLISEMPIVVNNIKDNQQVSNPIKIEGKARGSWFFEAVFPIQLIDDNGNIIASTQAHAESDWATSSFVNFTAIIDYIKSTSTKHALIVLSNDNPSGNPDFDQSIFIPVILK